MFWHLSNVTKCALSLTAAFPVMVFVGVVGHALLGHGPVVPMPGADIDLGVAAAWVMSIGVGDGVRRAVQHLL